jgi:four helix bundle protein
MPLFTRSPGNYFLAHNATLTGDITIGELSSFWVNAVVRGDVAPVTIGKRVNVQDCAGVHCDTDVPNVIEDDVVIGHNATVHGIRVGRGSLIGMGATVLSRSKIGQECLIAAGAVVPPGLEVPDRMAVMGVPGKIIRPVKPEELDYMKWLAAHYVELAEKYVRGAFEFKIQNSKLRRRRMANRELCERTFNFSVRVVHLCRYLDKRAGVMRRMIGQLLNAGTSVGANFEESQAAQSRKDFIHKLEVSLKEARESHYWLRLLVASDVVSAKRVSALLQEASEIAAILAKIIITSKRRIARAPE